MMGKHFSMSEQRRSTVVKELIEVTKELDSGTVKGLTDLQYREEKLRSELIAAGFDPDQEMKDENHWPIDTAFGGDDVPWEDTTPVKKNWKDYSSYGGKGSGLKTYPKCAHSHPPLKIGDLQIMGGSCYSPQKGPYDIEIGFDRGMKTPNALLPWETQFVRLPIPDQKVPPVFEDFDRLVDWTIERMKAGKSVHCGCIGGHGRTGLFLSVLYFKMTGDQNSTAYLRQHYCKKAVESQSQIDWLHKHYGIAKVEPVKSTSHYNATSKKDKDAVKNVKFGKKHTSSLPLSHPSSKAHDVARCIKGKSVWGDNSLD